MILQDKLTFNSFAQSTANGPTGLAQRALPLAGLAQNRAPEKLTLLCSLAATHARATPQKTKPATMEDALVCLQSQPSKKNNVLGNSHPFSRLRLGELGRLGRMQRDV